MLLLYLRLVLLTLYFDLYTHTIIFDSSIIKIITHITINNKGGGERA